MSIFVIFRPKLGRSSGAEVNINKIQIVLASKLIKKVTPTLRHVYKSQIVFPLFPKICSKKKFAPMAGHINQWYCPFVSAGKSLSN